MRNATNRHDADNNTEIQRALTAGLVRRFGLSEFCASLLATEIAGEIQIELGGNEIYIPAQDKTERNHAIRSEFAGNNHGALAKKYGISCRQVRNIVAG